MRLFTPTLSTTNRIASLTNGPLWQRNGISLSKKHFTNFIALVFAILCMQQVSAQICYSSTNYWAGGYYLGGNGITCTSATSGGSVSYGYTGGLQYYTVPSGVYSINITANGAQGGGGYGSSGGLGASETGTFSVSPGQVITIMVGGQGGSGNNGGGGGGTFVVNSSNTPLIIAGGGGGGYYNGYSAGANSGCSWDQGTTSTSGNGGVYGAGGAGESNGGAGPNGGNYSTSYYTCHTGAGGGGFSGNGGTSPSCDGNTTAHGGYAFLNGGAGGAAVGPAGSGGYGGGGGADWYYWTGGGGGGGYGGGGGGVYYGMGGGGGSYNAGSGASGTCGIIYGNGSVNISYGISLASTQYFEWDGIAGQNYSFAINAGSGWNQPAYQYWQYNGSSWQYISEGTAPSGTAFNITPTISDPSPGAGWHLLVILNGTSCVNGFTPWVGTSATLTYRRTSGPIPTNASVSNSCWVANGSNTYTVNCSAQNSSNNDYGGPYGILGLINLQGTDAGAYGGYFSWNPTIGGLNSGGYTTNQYAASGGGYVGQCPCYGSAGVTLTGGSISYSGYTATASFNVVPNSSFPAENSTNAVSVYACDPCSQQNGWYNYQLNFGSGHAAITASAASTNICGEGTTTLTAGGDGGISWNWYSGSGGSGNNYGSANPITVGGDQTYYAYATSYCGVTSQAGPITISTSTTPPSITAPAAISTNNSPNNSGSAAETFAAPTGSSSCSGEWAGGFNLASTSGPLSSVASNLKFWVKGDAGVVKDGNGNVSEWRDISGNSGGNKFYQATSGYRPTRTASSSSFNGYPVITFNTGQFLPQVTSLDGGGLSNYTIFVVDRQNGGSNQRLCSSATTNWLFGNWSGGEEQCYCNGWIIPSPGSPGADVLPHMYELTSASNSGSGTNFYDYGKLIATNTAGSPNGPGALQLNGWSNGLNEMSAGDVAEVIYYNTVLTTAQRQIVEGYLAYKYNLPCPYASAQAYQTYAATTTEGFIATDQSSNTAVTTSTASKSSYPGPTVSTPAAVCSGTNVALTATGMSPAGSCLTTGTGSSNYLLVGTSGSTSNVTLGTNWTLEAWVKFPLAANGSWNTMFRGIGYHPIIVERTQGATNAGLILGAYQGGFYPASNAYTVNGTYIGGNSGLVESVDISTLSAGWHHIAATGSGGTESFYVDGVFVGKAATEVQNDNIVAVGNYQGGGQDFGTMDEVKVYNVALSQNTISNYMTQASTSATDPNWNNLVAYYKMDASPVVNSATGSAACSSCNGTVQASATAGSTATAFYTYSWSGPGSPSFSPAATTTSESVTVSAPTTANSGTYTVSATANSIVSNGTNVTVTINPNATIALTSAGGTNAQTVCYNTAITPITYSIGGGGTGATFSGLPGGVSGSYSGGVATINGTPSTGVSGTFSYTVNTTGSCAQTSATGTITVNPNLTASQSGGNSPICYNATPATFTATASGGTGTFSYLWYKNNSPTGVTSSTYSAGALTSTSTIYCAVTSGTCGTVNTTPYIVSVNANLTASQSGGSSPICYNSAPAAFTATAGGGTGAYSYVWYSNNTATGVTTSTYGPTGMTATATIYCAVTSGTCGTVNTTPFTVSVNANLTASQTGGSSPLCYNTAPGTFTATAAGGTGSYSYLWYMNGGSTGTSTTTYAPGNLTGTSTIYCAVTSGTCGTVNTTPATITVYGNLSASISGGSTPICYNASAGTFTATASGGPGSYTYIWYLNNTSIGGATNSQYAPGNITASSTYYCAVTSGGCGTTNTGNSAITVYPNLTATISGGTTPICYNTSPGSFTATGSGGNGIYTYQWYNNTSAIGGSTASTYTAPSLTGNDAYRCSVTSGAGCGSISTGTASIVAEPPVSSYGSVNSAAGLSQTVCNNVAPNNGNPFTATGAAGSSGTFSYQWYYQNGLVAAPSGSNTTGWTACGVAQGTGYNTANFTATGGSVNITYACVVTPAAPVCAPGQWATNDIQITVLTTGPQESAAGAGNFCLNATGVLLTSNLSAVIPATYQWYSSTSIGFGSPTTISGATSTSYAPPTGASGTLYYEIVATFSGSGCTPATSPAQTIQIYTVPTASQSGGSSPICDSTDPGTFTAIGSGGSGSFSYVWYNNSGAISGATSSTYDPGRLTASNAYHCTVTDVAGCGANATTPFSVFVDAAVAASQTGGTSPICYNTSPGTFTATASGGTGSYTYQWYDASGAVPGQTSSTYNPGNITASSNYFCSVTSGTCGSVGSSPVANITVRANLTANISGGTSPICYNTPPGTFRVIASGGTGTYTYQWWNTAGPISGATASSYAPGNLTASDIFHCNVSSGVCGSVNSATVSIIVDPILSATIAGGITPICYGADPGAFTATGAGGTGSYTYQWYNTTGSISGQTASTYDPGNITASNTYRCSVTSGTCGTVATSTTSITVDANLTATISGGTSPICYSTSPGTFTATGAGGDGTYTYQWYDGGGSLSGATASTYAPGNLTISNSYRCSVTSGSCGTVSTAQTAIVVDGDLTAAISGGTSPLCYNTPPGTFTATAAGGTGSYAYQWFNTAGSIGGATSSTFAPGNITVSTTYHCAVTSGSCGTVNTSGTAISVDADLTATLSGGTSPICYNSTPGTLTATGAGATGSYTYQWYDNTGTIGGATVSTFAPGSLTATNTYHCAITSGSCGTVNSSSQTINVDADLSATISGGTTPICYNTAPGTFTATANGGTTTYSYQWYSSAGPVGGATASTYAPGNLTVSESYHCQVTSGSCGTINTPAASIIVNAATTATASNNSPYVVGQTITLTSSSANGVSYSWSGPGYSASGQTVNISNATTAMTGTYTVTATNSSGCTATASTNVVVTLTASYTWTGTNSNDWTDPGNWSPNSQVGGPNACALDVIIPNVTNSPVIISMVQVGNIQIDAAAQLTLNGANINVCKNWVGGIGTKSVVAGNGVVVMNGSSAQTISGLNQVQELMIDNTAGVSMLGSSTMDIYTSLDLSSGNMDVTNGIMTFKSATTDSVAILDNFSSGYTGTISGNIRAERYYAASQTYDQHYMGSPVNTPALSQFGASGTAGYIVDPTCDETHLPTYSPYGTVFSLHESHGTNCGMQQWKSETAASLPNVQNGVGYSLLRAGAGTLTLAGAPNLNTIYSVSGLTNSGWQNTTAQNHIERSGWQLLSNPYLAPLKISSVSAGFDNQVLVWNADGPFANSYQPHTIGVDANIAPFQAFMVHKTTTGGSAAFNINASDRVRAMYAFHAANANELNILAQNVNTGKLDQTMVAFNAAATDTFDPQYDATKFAGSLNRHTLYTVNNDMWMSRNVLNNIATTSTVPMGFEPGANGAYKLTFNGLNTFDPTSYIYLEDKTLNVMYNVRNGDYQFTADSADNWNRFVLHFTPPALITSTDATCQASGVIQIQQPGTANWNYTLTDGGNAIVTSGTLNQSQQVTVGVAAGNYTLTLIDTNNYVVTKTITVNGAEMITADFDAPATALQVNQPATLTAITANAATYQWNFGNGTSATGATATATYTQPGVYSVSLQVTSTTGCVSTKTRAITVDAVATGLNNLTTDKLEIWSHDNKVFVDFTGLHSADATVIIYDVLGQEISNEKVTNTILYSKQINGIEAAYLIVMVKNDNDIVTKKVLITNMK